MELTPESIEESTAGFCLKIQGKTLYLTPLLAMKKFRKRGNKEGALSAFHKLQEEGLGKMRTQEGSKGPTSVSTCNNKFRKHILCKYLAMKPEVKCKSTVGIICQVQIFVKYITVRLSSSTTVI